MRKLGCVPPQFATNVSLMCRGKLDPTLFDAEVENYFYDLAIDSEPSNCSTPCTTLDISTTLIGQTPRVNGSMVKLIMDKETTVVIVDFSMDIFKLTAEVGGYLGLWLGWSVLTFFKEIPIMAVRILSVMFKRIPQASAQPMPKQRYHPNHPAQRPSNRMQRMMEEKLRN